MADNSRNTRARRSKNPARPAADNTAEQALYGRVDVNNAPQENMTKQQPRKKAAAGEQKPAAGGEQKPRQSKPRPPKQTPEMPAGEPKPRQPRKPRPEGARNAKNDARPTDRGPRQPRQRQPREQEIVPAVEYVPAAPSASVKVVFLGGINEIGKNLTAYECGNDIIVVDCGTSFPDDDMLGIDLVIPDYTYLEKNKSRVRGIVITHGHEDHIGGLPYLLKVIDCPVYATRLTCGLIANKLTEAGLLEKVKLNIVAPRDVVKFGCMSVEFIRVNHSIPDAVAVAITTPKGVIVQTGDFKIDYTPISGEIIDIARFGELGSQGVLALLCDSTNAERPGSTKSERMVGESFVNLFSKAGNRRIIIATFSSNIHRIQQVIDLAEKVGRKVVISGRSMINVTTTAMELGYLHAPDGLIIDIDAIHRYPPEKLVVVTTGSQGEPMSALFRMAMGDHRKLEVSVNDFIIISATPIPGNEKLVGRVVNELMKQGAEVIYESMYEVHVSGHACRDELRLMHGLVRPKYFVPVHGEYKHLWKHAQIAREMGMADDHIFIPDIGKVLEFSDKGVNMSATVPAGRVLVDGLGVGDVGSVVLRDRKHLAQDGLIIVTVVMDKATGAVVSTPEIVSRGFVYVREAEPLMVEAAGVVNAALVECQNRKMREFSNVKAYVRDSLSTFVYGKTKRNPMILTIIMTV